MNQRTDVPQAGIAANKPIPASVTLAIPWVGGWLALMVVIAVAGREATHQLAVFQIMELRSLIGLFLLYPLVRASGGLMGMKSTVLPYHVLRNLVHYAVSMAGCWPSP